MRHGAPLDCVRNQRARLPLGVVAGPFLGALAGEMVSGKPFGMSLKGAFGALLGYVCGVMLKVFCCGFIAYQFWLAVHGS